MLQYKTEALDGSVSCKCVPNIHQKLEPKTFSWKSPNIKKCKYIILYQHLWVISMFDLHTVNLKCFCSFMCPLNVVSEHFIKNFNRKLSPGIC